MSNRNSLSRRELLSLLGLTAGASAFESPLQLILNSMLSGIVSKAHAQALGITPRKYVYVQQPGAPSRWSFDLFLQAYSSNGFVANPMVGTSYTSSNSRYTGTDYTTTPYKGVNAPHMWKFAVPKASGGTRPMTDLLDNLLCLQGINLGVDGHPRNQGVHFLPPGGTASINALVGDQSDKPIPTIDMGCSLFAFRSRVGKSYVPLPGGGNLLNKLLTPFMRKTSAGFLNSKSQLQGVIDQSLAALDAQSKSNSPLSESLNISRSGASELIERGFSDVVSFWAPTVTKYKTLIQRAIDPLQRFAGVNAQPIGITTTRDGTYQLNGATNIVNMPDLRDLIVSTTIISVLAERFAVAEYVLLNNISDSVALRSAHLGKLSVITGQNSATNFQSDEHTTGSMPSLYMNFMYNRALSACLLEFIDQLKSKNLFKETVIDVSGEFNRSPRVDGSGSDHGWQGASVSLYSGAFNGPLILGNLTNDTRAKYLGTWGFAGGVDALKGQTLGVAHMASTIAHVLRTTSPVTSAQSVVKLDDTGLTPLIEKSKIV